MAEVIYMGMLTEALGAGKYKMGSTLKPLTRVVITEEGAEDKARRLAARHVLDTWKGAPPKGEFLMALYEGGHAVRYLVRYEQGHFVHNIRITPEPVPADLQKALDSAAGLMLSLEEEIRLRGQQVGCLLAHDREHKEGGIPA